MVESVLLSALERSPTSLDLLWAISSTGTGTAGNVGSNRPFGN